MYTDFKSIKKKKNVKQQQRNKKTTKLQITWDGAGNWSQTGTRAGAHLRSVSVTGGDLRRRARMKSSRYQHPMAMMHSALRQLSRNAWLVACEITPGWMGLRLGLG